MDCVSFVAEQDDINKRIDMFLSTELENMSRNAVQKIIENGNVSVNGKNVNKNYKISNMDFIEVQIPEPVSLNVEAENIDIDILYEDNDVIVINKQQGMVVHPAAGHYNGTLVNALMYHCGKNLSAINGVLRPGIVHRIDKDTSGILVVAKNDNAHRSLAEQLANHSMTRVYNAIVFNNIKVDNGTINKPIGRNPIDRKKMAITEKNSKNAITHFKVIERFGKFCFVELHLETGRTHQIRVHMASIGHALLGDMVYGSQKQPFNLNGQTLHAKVLGFIHPKTNKYMEFQTDLPKYFSDILNKIK